MLASDELLLSDFLISNDVMSEIKCGNLKKTTVLLASEHHSDQMKCYKRFSYTFLQGNRSLKNAMPIECQRMWHQGGLQPKWQPHYFIEYKAISKIFAVYRYSPYEKADRKRP